MLKHLSEYHRPSNLGEALGLLARSDIVTVPLAGGTWLIPSGVAGARAVVDLRDLTLDQVEVTADGLRLGATVTLQTVIDDPRTATFAGSILAEAARHSALRNIRNVATLGGTVATAGPLDELLLALLALDTQVRLVDRTGQRRLSLDGFLTDPAGHLPRGTLIAELVIPTLPSGTGAGLARVARTVQDQPIVSAAAVLSSLDGKCTHARLALAGVARRPTRLPEVEEMLIGQEVRVENLGGISARIRTLVDPISDFRASAEYRREMTGIVGRRALQVAWEQTIAGGKQ